MPMNKCGRGIFDAIQLSNFGHLFFGCAILWNILITRSPIVVSYIRSQLEFLQAIIIFAADLRIVSGAAGDLEQGLANATQSLGSLRRLLPTLELNGNRRASLEKWIEQS